MSPQQQDLSDDTSSLLAADAAAHIIQSWYRSRCLCHRANCLLLWLHVLHLAHAEEEDTNGAQYSYKRSHSAPSAKESASLIFSSAGAPFASIATSSNATVISQLIEVVYEYEAAKINENYTRALLLEELLKTSVAAQGASAEARRRLRQQHAALRHLALSESLANAALRSHKPFFISERHDTAAKSKVQDKYVSIDVVDVLRELETLLGPSHFAWWKGTAEGLGAERSADAAVVMKPDSSGNSLLPVPLNPVTMYGFDMNSDDSNIDGVADLDVFVVADDSVTATTQQDNEADTAPLCVEQRSAAGAAAYEAAKQATLAGSPVADKKRKAWCANGNTAATVESALSRSIVTDEQLEDIQYVLRPVLGNGISGQWRRSSLNSADEAVSFSSPSALTCVVCELDGVLLRTDDAHNSSDEGDDVEEVLVKCATCGALVHKCCAYSEESNGAKRYFCCCYCCTT